MGRRIVIGYDGERGGRDAVALGAALAEPLGAELVVAVVFPQPRDASADVAGELADPLLKTADRLLGDRSAEMRALCSASPAHGLHEVAEQEEAALVVLGASHRGQLGRVLLGNVGESFVSGAPCATAVAPGGWAEGAKSLSRIGAGINGSEDSWHALHAATELARGVDGTLAVVAAIEPMSYGYTSAVLGALSGEASQGLAEAEVERLLERAANGVRGLAVERRLLIGDPGRTLVEAAQDLDLLIVGSRGYGPMRRVLLGGVSAKLMRTSPCPVIVLPRGVPDPFGTG